MSEAEEPSAVPEPVAAASAAADAAAAVAPAPKRVSGAELLAGMKQLRGQVCGLGIGMLLVSLCFNVFVFQQNRTLKAAAETRLHQLKQLKEFEDRVRPALQELAGYSAGKPDLSALFTKYGMKIGPAEKPAAEKPPAPLAP